jgi:hypothetical protein
MLTWRTQIVDSNCRPISTPIEVKVKKFDADYAEYFYTTFFDLSGAAYMNRLFDSNIFFVVPEPGRYQVEVYSTTGTLLTTIPASILSDGREPDNIEIE